MDTFIKTRPKKGKSLVDFPDSFVVFDVETTGLDSKIEEIIEIGALKVVNNEVVDTFSSLIKPEKVIPDFITSLTGIDNDMVKDAPLGAEVLEKFKQFIDGFILVGHNVNFDIDFIYDSLERNNMEAISNNYVDTLKLARFLLPRMRHKLGNLANFFGIDTEGAHRSLKDCELTLGVLNSLKKLAIMKYESVDGLKKAYYKKDEVGNL